ncbi:MAG TPA: rhomboid family intramembrane serine protease [Flavobacteriaceae bacterium]|nr:rhomboid family intramembrane serine protease [Flavobacteriaceae bacterium]
MTNNFNIIIGAIIAANVIFSMRGFKDVAFFNKFKFNIRQIRSGENIRYLSSGFLHVDTTHLIFNMLTFFFFAPVIVAYMGDIKMAIIYFVSLLIGNIFSFFYHKDELHYSAVGASGAVMGILYAAILLNPDMTLLLFFVLPIPAWLFGIAYLGYSIYGMKNQRDNIGHDAHIGGAVAGYVLTLAFFPHLLQTSLWIVLLLALPILILFVLTRLGKI